MGWVDGGVGGSQERVAAFFVGVLFFAFFFVQRGWLNGVVWALCVCVLCRRSVGR